MSVIADVAGAASVSQVQRTRIHFLASFHKCDTDVSIINTYLHETGEQVNGKCFAHDFCVCVAHAFAAYASTAVFFLAISLYILCTIQFLGLFCTVDF